MEDNYNLYLAHIIFEYLYRSTFYVLYIHPFLTARLYDQRVTNLTCLNIQLIISKLKMLSSITMICNKFTLCVTYNFYRSNGRCSSKSTRRRRYVLTKFDEHLKMNLRRINVTSKTAITRQKTIIQTQKATYDLPQYIMIN